MILHLDHPAALAADQELRGMRVALAVGIDGTSRDAADECGQPLHPMDQPLLQQEVERPIHRGRRRTAPRLAQPVQQVVGARRRCGVEDHAEHVPTQFRQVRPAMLADRLRPIEQRLRPSREFSRHSIDPCRRRTLSMPADGCVRYVIVLHTARRHPKRPAMMALRVLTVILALLAGPAAAQTRHQHRRGRELLRRCRATTRGRRRHGQQHPEQPRPGPASVRGEPIGCPPPVERRDRDLQRRRLRSLDDEAAGRLAVAGPQGHRRGRSRAQEGGRQSASLVRSADDAGLCQGAGRGTVGARPGAQERLRPEAARLPRLAAAAGSEDRRTAPASSAASPSPPPSRCSATWRPHSASGCATSASSSRS